MSVRSSDNSSAPIRSLTEPEVDSQASAARALLALFMHNADAGNDAANDELIALMDQRRHHGPN